MMYAVSLLYAFQSEFYSGLIALGLATFVGSYIPAKFMERLEKDKLYMYEITSNTLNDGKKFADTLRDCNIPVSTSIVHDKKMNKVLMCRVYSQSKCDSRTVEGLIPEAFKYTIISSTVKE